MSKALKKKVVVGAYVGVAVRDKLASIAAKLDTSVSELAGYILTTVCEKPGVDDELVKLEVEKKQRLIRYIM